MDKNLDKYAQAVRMRDQRQSMEAVSRAGGVFGNAWLIAGVFVVVTALGVMHVLSMTPLYEASTVIQIKRNAGFASDFQTAANVGTEMEILKSRSVLARVAERLQLDLTLDPAPPTFTQVLRRLPGRDQSAGRDVSPHAQVQVARFDLPPALLAVPFTMTMQARGAFHLASDELGIGADGVAGTPLRMASRYGPIDLLVGSSAAAPGTRWVVRRVAPAQATEQLQRALVVTENAKQSDVIRLTLQGANQQLMSRILGDIVAEYRQRRRGEQASEAAALSAAYDRQLQAAEAAVRQVERQYAGLLQRSGVRDPEAEGQLLLQQSGALEMRLAAAQQRKAELSARIGDGHPEMQAINGQIADTGRVLGRNAARYASLAAASRELAQVRREKQALDEAALAVASQRSKFNAVALSGRDDVRVLEPPQSSLRPITLGRSTMLVLACCAGIAAGLLASFTKNFFLQRKRLFLPAHGHTRFRLIAQGRPG